MARKASSKPADATANLGFETKLRLAANKLRNNMDAAEPERSGDSQPQAARRASRSLRVKYISDSFEEHRAKFLVGEGQYAGANAKDPDEPSEAKQTASSTARKVSAANQYFLTQPSGARSTSKGSLQGELGGVHQFYPPTCVVRLLVEMLAPYNALRDSAFLQREASPPQVLSSAKDNGSIYDPTCSSHGNLPAQSRLRRMRYAVQDRAIAPIGVQSLDQDKWAQRQRPFGLAERSRRVRLRGQQPKQSNATTRRLAIMNLAIRGIEADFGPEHADSFRRDLHPFGPSFHSRFLQAS